MKHYLVFDKACHRPGYIGNDKVEACQILEELARDGLLYRMQESDDGGDTWRDITDDEIEALSQDWLDTHYKTDWPDMPNFVWNSTAYYRREQGAA